MTMPTSATYYFQISGQSAFTLGPRAEQADASMGSGNFLFI